MCGSKWGPVSGLTAECPFTFTGAVLLNGFDLFFGTVSIARALRLWAGERRCSGRCLYRQIQPYAFPNNDRQRLRNDLDLENLLARDQVLIRVRIQFPIAADAYPARL